MAFGISGIKVYPVKAHTPLASQYLQVATFTLTALASDVTANLKTIAEASAADGASSLAEALRECTAVVSLYSDVSARTTAAAGASYSLVSTTPSAPVLSFTGTASTPLTQVISIVMQPFNDSTPVVFGV